MLSHRHLLRQCARPKILRSFSSTSRVDFPAQTKGEGEEQGEGDWSVPRDPLWGVWKKTIGKQFEEAHIGHVIGLEAKVVSSLSPSGIGNRTSLLLLNAVWLSATFR